MGVRNPLIVFLILLTTFLGCGQGREDQSASLTAFCGSASKPAMQEIAARFERETGIEANMVFGGSGTLLSQIEFSRQGEICLPGSPDYVIIGSRKKLLIEGSQGIVASLVPAIITPGGNPANVQSLQDLARLGVRVDIGNPQTVCRELYSVELLEANGLLEKVKKNVVTFGASCTKPALPITSYFLSKHLQNPTVSPGQHSFSTVIHCADFNFRSEIVSLALSVEKPIDKISLLALLTGHQYFETKV